MTKQPKLQASSVALAAADGVLCAHRSIKVTDLTSTMSSLILSNKHVMQAPTGAKIIDVNFYNRESISQYGRR